MIVRIVDPMEKLSEGQIAAAEVSLGRALPADYRAFISRNNGGSPDPDAFDIHWPSDRDVELAQDWRTSSVSYFLSIHDGRVCNLIRYNLVTFAGRIPPETLAIASDPGGNLLLLAVEGAHIGSVLFWVKDAEVDCGAPGYANVGVVANSLEQLLGDKLYRRS